jgi:general secretion pathway protein C
MRIGKFNVSQNSNIFKIILYGTIALAAFSIADLTVIYYRDKMIPDSPPPKKQTVIKPQHFVDRSQYSVITNRNLFSSLGVIPDAVTANKIGTLKEADPTPSALPLVLIGTLVHSNPAKSIAAIEVKSKSLTGSYITGAEIEGLAKVESVERNRVYIRNNNTGAKEYIEMNKAGNKVSFDAAKAALPSKPGGSEVQITGTNQFQIKKSDLLKYTNDLSSVLMQARAVPNRDPNTGEINGFRILDMQQGSIYEQLGLQRMDIIKGVNGEPIDSVQKAMELYNTLKNGNQVKLLIDRGGKSDTFTYDVK